MKTKKKKLTLDEAEDKRNQMAEQTNGVPTLNFQHTDDFISLYANNVQFEQSAFDLKLIFGELNQAGGKALVDQHSSMTIPWGQAKLLLYYLQVNIGPRV